MKVASFSLAEARMASDGIFTQQALETVETASFKLRTDTDNVAGVLLPIFKIDNAGNNFFELMGLGRGGTEIRKSVKHYERALDILVRIQTIEFDALFNAMLISSFSFLGSTCVAADFVCNA